MVIERMEGCKLKIESDFTDYYDYLSVNDGYSYRYVRNYKDSLPKGKDLAELRRLGIATVQVGSVRELNSMYKQLVVYTDVTKHRGEGKVIMDSHEAILTYPTSLASPYIENGGITNKFLQIGSRRFRVVLENVYPLKTGRVLSLDEIQPDYNYSVRLPIFSIDYISTAYGLIAVDFNTVQELKTLGIDRIMQPYEVVSEISKALSKYNIHTI